MAFAFVLMPKYREFFASMCDPDRHRAATMIRNLMTNMLP